MDEAEIQRILQAVRTTADLQQKTISEVISRLTVLADRLEPLAQILEHMTGTFDGNVQRLETVTLAEVKLLQQLRQLYEKEVKEAEEAERHPQGII